MKYMYMKIIVCFILSAFAGHAAAVQSEQKENTGAQPALIVAQRDITLLPPEVNHNPGQEYSDAQRGFAMILGMERTPNGRLWMSWIAGGDSEMGYALLAFSDNDGQSWTPPTTVIDPKDEKGLPPLRVLVGNLWTDPQGRLWFFFDYSMGYFDGRAGTWAMVCDNPDAEKPQWSQPRRIWHGAVLSKPIVLSDGSWLMLISLWDNGKVWPYSKDKDNPGPAGFKTMFTDLDEYRMVNVFKSADSGQSWQRIGGVRFPNPQFDEPMVIERRDGSLWMLARTSIGIHETVSSDKGQTWTSPAPAAGICNTSSRHFLRRLSSGNLLLVKHGRQIDKYVGGAEVFTKKRSELTAFISDDDGRTWKGGLLLDEREPVTYPDGVQSPDGSIYICYDYDRFKERQIVMAKFTEADVLAGKLVSDGSRLKILVSKATGKSTEAVKPAPLKLIPAKSSTSQFPRKERRPIIIKKVE